MTVNYINNDIQSAYVKNLKIDDQNRQALSKSTILQSLLKSTRLEQHFSERLKPFSSPETISFKHMLEDTSPLDSLTSFNELTNPISFENDPVNHVNNAALAIANVGDFVKALWPKAKQAASLIGLDPKLLIAQAALETGWGKFIAKDADGSTSNNLFNIKTGVSKSVDSITIKTHEYKEETLISENASFRKYLSMEHSFNDYISLIQSDKRYQNALANTGNSELYINELHKAGYATDPNYEHKILAIYYGEKLNHALQNVNT